jgi:2-polyprenyl-3-methyl-5-hydroxy-6-metoxy-1,4-benzoquinol methylase
MSGFVEITRQRFNYWFPHIHNPQKTQRELDTFYATRQDYHQMTDDKNRHTHPQVQLFLQQVKPNSVCAEFGCGGGMVLAAVAKRVRLTIGIDIASIALGKAQQRVDTGCQIALLKADIAEAPLCGGVVDVAYSFEVLEHVWNPEIVITEMIRVLKPGGLLFFTTPNQFSLDLHLQTHRLFRLLNLLGAAACWLRSLASRRSFRNIEPDLCSNQVYPDCDMISSFFPRNLRRFLKRNGCALERMETFFFQQMKTDDDIVRHRYQQLDRHPFYRNFGDHILCIARKKQ